MTGSCCHLQTLCFLCSALVILQGNINIMWPRMPHSEAKSGVSSHWIRNLQGGISLVVVKTGSFHYKGWRFDPWLGKFHMPEKTKKSGSLQVPSGITALDWNPSWSWSLWALFSYYLVRLYEKSYSVTSMNEKKWKMLSHVFVTPWTTACQTSLSLGFPR